jgi:hypothetical protein
MSDKKRFHLDVGRQIGHDRLVFTPGATNCSFRFVHLLHQTSYERPVELSKELAEELLKFLPEGTYLE